MSYTFLSKKTNQTYDVYKDMTEFTDYFIPWLNNIDTTYRPPSSIPDGRGMYTRLTLSDLFQTDFYGNVFTITKDWKLFRQLSNGDTSLDPYDTQVNEIQNSNL